MKTISNIFFIRNILILLVIAISFANCSKKTNSLIIKDYKTVEGIKIGMPMKTAIKIAESNYVAQKVKTAVLDDAPETFEYVVYKNSSKKETLFTFNSGYEKKNKDSVFRIVLKDPKYLTEEGIKVGMTVEELKAKAKLKSADFNFQDGLYIMSSKFDGGYWIDLDAKKDYKEFSFDNPPLKAIPGNLKIKGIVIF
jgi:hypothetical protein